jgi:hypothetical protein
LSKQAFATNLSSDSEKICDAQKPAMSVVAAVADKKKLLWKKCPCSNLLPLSENCRLVSQDDLTNAFTIQE